MSAIFDPPYPIPYNPINGTVEAFEGTIRPVYNVLDYGADPSGQKDSTAAIQAALDAAGSLGGGTVFGSGQFKCTIISPAKTATQGGGYVLSIPSNTRLLLAPGSTMVGPELPSGASGGYSFLVNSDINNGNSNVVVDGGTYNLVAPTTNATGMVAWWNLAAFMGCIHSWVSSRTVINNGGVAFYPISSELNQPTALTAGHNYDNRISATFYNVTGSCTFFQGVDSAFDGYINGCWDDAFLVGSAGLGIRVAGTIIGVPASSGLGGTSGTVYVANDGAVGAGASYMSGIMICPRRVIGGGGNFNSGLQAVVCLDGAMENIIIDTNASNGKIGLFAVNATVQNGKIRGNYYSNVAQGINFTINAGTHSQEWDIDAYVWGNGTGGATSGMYVYTEGGNIISGHVVLRGIAGAGGNQTSDIEAVQDVGGYIEMVFEDGDWPNGASTAGSGFGSSILRNNKGYNPVGPVTVAVPASGTATAALPYDATFYITQATAASSVAVQGQTIAIPIGGPTAIRVPAGQTLTPTYTTAPTWVVMGD